MITIDLYQNSAEVIRVDKTNYLKLYKTIQGVFRDNTSIVNPSITIQMEDSTPYNVLADNIQVVDETGTNVIARQAGDYQLLKANYLYIKEFDRYYYIDEITTITANMFQIDCSIDPLMSFKEGIKKLTAFVERNEFTYNSKLIDNKVIISQGSKIDKIDFDITNNIFDIYSTDYYFTLTGFALKNNSIRAISDESTPRANETQTGVAQSGSRKLLDDTYFARTFSLNQMGVLDLANFLIQPVNWGNALAVLFSDPRNYIQSLIYFPVNFDKVINNAETYLQIATVNTSVKVKEINELTDTFFDLGTIHCTPAKLGMSSDSFELYNGYSEYSLWLPYYSIVNIDGNEIVNRYLSIALGIDTKTGQAIYYILVSDTPIDRTIGKANAGDKFKYCRILQTLSFQLGTQIPLGSSEAIQVYRNIIGGAVKAIGAVASGGVGAMVNPNTTYDRSTTTTKSFDKHTIKKKKTKNASGKKTMQIAGKTDVTGDVTTTTSGTSTRSNVENYLARGYSEALDISLSSLANMSGTATTDIVNNPQLLHEAPKVPILFRKYPNFEPRGEDYGRLRGYPLGQTKVLGTLTGYTEISEVHIEGADFSTSTGEERATIIESLMGGFIL